MPFCGRVNETLFTGFYPESRNYKTLNFTLKNTTEPKKSPQYILCHPCLPHCFVVCPQFSALMCLSSVTETSVS